MKFAQIENNIVVNVISADSTPEMLGEYVDISNTRVGIGFSYQNGEFVEPAVIAPEETVPNEVTAFQAKAALYLSGHLSAVEAYIAQEDTPFLTKLAWQSASFHRSSDMVIGVGNLLGLTPEEIDNLFSQAAQIR